MIECKTIEEAAAVPGVVHIEAGEPVKAYVQGDKLPGHLVATQTDVPQSVPMAQARLALLAAGKLDAVDAAIAALPEPDQSAARIRWEYEQSVNRQDALVLALAPAIGLDDAGLDKLFTDAADR